MDRMNIPGVASASPAPQDAMVYVKLLLTALFWGGTFIAGRLVAPETGTFTASFLRFVVASVFLLWMTYRREGRLPLPGRPYLLPLFLCGMTGVFLYNLFFFSGLRYMEAGRAALIVATNPVFIALFAALLFRDRLTAIRVLGICLCVTGAVAVISRGNPMSLLGGGAGRGELLIVGCVVSWVSYSLAGKWVMGGLSPMAAVTWSCLIGAAALLPAAVGEGLFRSLPDLSLSVWGALFYLGYFGSALGFTWYYEGIQRIGPSRAGVFINFVPLFAVLFAYFFFREPLDGSLLTGAAFVVTGAYLTNRGGGSAGKSAKTS